MKMQSEKLLTTSGKIPDARPVWKASTGLWLLSSCIKKTSSASSKKSSSSSSKKTSK